MSSFSPHSMFLAPAPEYEGIHLDAFFFVPTVIGLPAKPATSTEMDEFIGFSLSELTTL